MTDMEQKEELAEFDESVPLTAEDEEGNVTTVMEATTYDGETLTQLEEALSQLTKGKELRGGLRATVDAHWY